MKRIKFPPPYQHSPLKVTYWVEVAGTMGAAQKSRVYASAFFVQVSS